MARLTAGSQLVERLFGPIEDPATARALSRDPGVGLLLVAALQTALALFSGRDALVDAALLAISGALVWASAGRLAAAFALVVACGSAAMSVATLTLHAPASRGRSILLGLVAVWVAGRALVAALALRRLSRVAPPSEANDGEPPSETPT
jgi:hypothetical protein